MKKILAHQSARVLCWYLSLSLAGAIFLPSLARAAFIPVATDLPAYEEKDLLAIRAALEDEILEKKLISLGFSPSEVKARLDHLTPEERTEVVHHIQMLQSGGQGSWGYMGGGNPPPQDVDLPPPTN